MGREVELKLFAPVNERKEFTGNLKGYENGVISISDEKNAVMKFEKSNVAIIRRTIKF
jgi:ribosome maturation factor RimP